MEQQVHFFNHKDEKLAGTLHRPPGPTADGIIWAHCFTCSRHTTILREICSQLARENFMALRFDFSGNGQSEGVFNESTYSKQIAEIASAAAFMATQGVAWLGLAGHSMGAAIAVLAAARMASARAVCALAGRFSGSRAAQYLSQRQRDELQNSGRVAFSSRGRALELTQAFFADAHQYDLLQTVKSLPAPLLVIHGDDDQIVPVQEAHAAHGANPRTSRLEIIPGADHMFSRPEHRQQAVQLVVEWLKEQRSRP